MTEVKPDYAAIIFTIQQLEFNIAGNTRKIASLQHRPQTNFEVSVEENAAKSNENSLKIDNLEKEKIKMRAKINRFYENVPGIV